MKILFPFLIVFALSADIRIEPENDINWPFGVCEKGTWTPEKLTLSKTPSRNTNHHVILVLII